MRQKDLNQELEEIARRELERSGFDGYFELEKFDGKPCFRGSIDPRNFKKISVKYNPEYEDENPGKIGKVIRDVTRHEINHRRYEGFNGCPRNLENHAELIVEPIARVLKGKGYGKNDIHYVANALEDTILQADLSREFVLDGQAGFWDDVGRHSPFSDFYEAYVKLNLYLWGNKREKKMLAKYFRHKNEVNEVVQNFLERTGISNLKQKVFVNGEEIEVKDRRAIREFLNDEKNWPRIAKVYAEEFSKLMQPGYALPLFNHSGNGTKGRGTEVEEGEGEEQGHEGDEPEGNPFDKAMYRSEFKKRRMKKAYENDEGIPPWMDYFEALDLVYQNLAQKLNIKVETFTQQDKMPLFWYGKRPFDPEKDNLKHVTFDFDEEGKVQLVKRKWHEDMDLEYKVKPKGFPEIRFCLIDTSGSMGRDPEGGLNKGRTSIIPWGDNSKYHYALLAWYGLLEYLKQNHLLKQTNISLANFSNETLLGKGLDKAKRMALKPQFGRTYINLDKIREIYKTHGALVFTISDGEVQNWGEIKDEFIKEVKKHHYFHLQIGYENEMTRDLEKAGLHVEYIKNARDLATKVIDLTDRLYRG